MDSRLILDFADGSADMAASLGGKGAVLAEMTRLLGPDRVPPGFTVTTEACNLREDVDDDLGPRLQAELDRAISRLESASGRGLGDPDDPLLVSVRSGARKSMPGMMDTVLNVGLTAESLPGLAASSGDERFALDCRLRFLSMYCEVVAAIPAVAIASAIGERSAGSAASACDRLLELHVAATGEEVPEDPRVQLRRAVIAVFNSWWGDRAIAWRRIHGIPDDWGTAANVQMMVFGNLGSDSGSGVAFSRNAVDGSPGPTGDWLPDAQGEDVVAGGMPTVGLDRLAEAIPSAHAQLLDDLAALETRFRDIQDVEFTIERGRLWILQARTAKRTARASVRFACDSVAEGLLTKGEALMTIDSSSFDTVLLPTLAQAIGRSEALGIGVGASPGAASGEIVLAAREAVVAAHAGRRVVLVRPSTSAEDVAGFHASAGIVTASGGSASHAALVARGMGRPCVCGVDALHVDEERGIVTFGRTGAELRIGDTITIDGSDGLVASGTRPVVPPTIDDRLATVLSWADGYRQLGVRANADSPADAAKAFSLGAEGIGLCRTEHMFSSPDRLDLVRRMILADDESERSELLDALLPMQRADFEGILAAAGGRTVTIRLLDPPLHEFLRAPESIRSDIDRCRREAEVGTVAGDARCRELRHELDRTLELTEANPMLGVRGVRLGLLHPEIHRMQVRAAVRAANRLVSSGHSTIDLELMVPLVAWPAELELARKEIERTIEDERPDSRVSIRVGTMIELPSACFTADRIARHADFFSFGTNDLTQTALGLSRDDTESTVLSRYLELGMFRRSPFASIDRSGVGSLVSLAADRGRTARPGLELGVCGEHAGDPESISFFNGLGIDYVSCSPSRIPTARLAAAQAALARNGTRADPSATRRLSLDPSRRRRGRSARSGARA